MTATATESAKSRRPARRGRAMAAALLLAMAAALASACAARQAEEILHLGGKIAYDSMKARHGSR